MRHRIIAMLPLVFLTGCVSVDPTADIQRAESLLRERSGLEAGWLLPWDGPVSGWDGSSTLTLHNATVIALRHNREIRADVEEIARSRADLAQAGLLPNPMLSIAVRFPSEGVTAVGGSLMQEFTSLWLRPSRMRGADAKLNETVLRVSDQALRLIADVRQSYVKIHYGEKAIELTKSHLDLLDQSVKGLQQRVAAGQTTVLDLNRLRVLRFEQQARLTRLETSVRRDRLELLEKMGLAGDLVSWTLDGTSVSTIGSIPLPAEPGLMELARSQRLDVAASGAMVDMRKHRLSEEELRRIQDLSIGVDAERDMDKIRMVGPAVTIGIPIFDTNQAQIAGAEAEYRAAAATASAVLQRAIRQVRQAWTEHSSARELIAIYQGQIVELAKQNLSLTEAELRAGKVDFTVLLEAQREIINARLELNDLEREAAVAHIELEYAVGGALPPSRQPN